MDLTKELELCIRSRFPLICIQSHEEERVIDVLNGLCESRRTPLVMWDHADFFQTLSGDAREGLRAKDPLSALEAVERAGGELVFLLRDFHQCWDNQPRVIRKVRNLAQQLKYTKKTLMISLPGGRLPPELRDEAVLIDVPPPDYHDLERILEHLLSTPKVRWEGDEGTRDRIIRSALGLSSSQAQRVFAKAIVSNGVLDERDIELINQEKSQIVGESGALEYIAPNAGLADVGGLENLKAWLRLRERAFGAKARDYGLPEPKGVALIGVPGTGKSLTARMVASLWRVPLIKLDMGALFGQFVGESEGNLRRALHLAETVAPCVLWIDEIEKGLSMGGGDGGTSQRVFGAMLSWMQDKRRPVFVVATANDVGRLPPELLRRGRFDETFFLDLPHAGERREIFEVHLRKRKRDPAGYNLDLLVTASEGYVGAEIEQTVIEAMYIAFNDGDGREFTTDDLMQALKKLVPLSRAQKERIADLRSWLVEGRAQSASYREAREASRRFVPIEAQR